MKGLRAVHRAIMISVVVVFIFGLIPLCWSEAQKNAGIYYSILFFTVLLGTSVALLLLASPISNSGKGTDYRVSHFTLRLSLTFGIGAVIVAVLLVVALLALRSLVSSSI